MTLVSFKDSRITPLYPGSRRTLRRVADAERLTVRVGGRVFLDIEALRDLVTRQRGATSEITIET